MVELEFGDKDFSRYAEELTITVFWQLGYISTAAVATGLVVIEVIFVVGV